MSLIERLLEPGSIELPTCKCGQQMEVAGFDPIPDRRDSHIRIFACPACDHQFRLTVWSADAAE